MPKSFSHQNNIKKVCSQIFIPINENTALCCKPIFQKLEIRKLFCKNENWTFLKMSKSEKISREFKSKKHALSEIPDKYFL